MLTQFVKIFVFEIVQAMDLSKFPAIDMVLFLIVL